MNAAKRMKIRYLVTTEGIGLFLPQEGRVVEILSSVDEILDFAIREEEETARFYTNLASQTGDTRMGQVFKGFAGEELGHKAKLLAIKQDKSLAPSAIEITDLDIADYLPDVKPSPDLDYLQALTVAMKGEKAAFRLYSDLAAKAKDEAVRSILLSLAQEEAKHKLRFEIEYDERTTQLAPDPER
jgi:rubrerythrin